MGDEGLRTAIATAFGQVPGDAARHLWDCDAEEFVAAARPEADWWGAPRGYFGPAYAAIAARFPGPDGTSEGERTEAEVDRIMRVAFDAMGMARPRILDLPCGTLRHARALAARGFDVTGVDLQQQLLCGDAPVPRAVADMRRLPLADGAFDLVLNLWNSFGYFLDEAEEIAALTEFRRVLRPGGLVLLQSDIEVRAVAEGRWAQHMKVPLGGGALFLLRQVPDAALGGLVCLSWVVLPGEAPWQSPSYFLRLLDDAAWHRLASAAGFSALRIDRTPPGVVPHETLALLFV